MLISRPSFGKEILLADDVKEGIDAHFVDQYEDVYKLALDYNANDSNVQIPRSTSEEDLIKDSQ